MDRARDHTASPSAFAPGGSQIDELLAGAPQSILARLCEGDPLGLQSRCIEVIRERALLVSAERLITKSAARVAFTAHRRPNARAFDSWLRAIIERSAEALLDEDIEADACEQEGDDDERYRFLGAALGVEMHVARRMCVVFHALPLLHRRAFHALILNSVPLEKAASELGLDAARLMRILRETLVQLSTLGRTPRSTQPEEAFDDE